MWYCFTVCTILTTVDQLMSHYMRHNMEELEIARLKFFDIQIKFQTVRWKSKDLSIRISVIESILWTNEEYESYNVKRWILVNLNSCNELNISIGIVNSCCLNGSCIRLLIINWTCNRYECIEVNQVWTRSRPNLIIG